MNVVDEVSPKKTVMPLRMGDSAVLVVKLTKLAASDCVRVSE